MTRDFQVLLLPVLVALAASCAASTYGRPDRSEVTLSVEGEEAVVYVINATSFESLGGRAAFEADPKKLEDFKVGRIDATGTARYLRNCKHWVVIQKADGTLEWTPIQVTHSGEIFSFKTG